MVGNGRVVLIFWKQENGDFSLGCELKHLIPDLWGKLCTDHLVNPKGYLGLIKKL